MLRSILVPLDGSELAERALAYATALSIPTAARLILVRAVKAHTVPGVDERFAQSDAVAEAEAYLATAAAQLAERGFVCDRAAPYGDVAEWIVEEARLRGADLIAMTSHARTGPGRWLLGSVAESVVAHSPVPVLVERAWRPIRRSPLLTEQPRLLIPLDGSNFAETVIDPAVGLAGDLGAELTLLRVEPLAPRAVTDANHGVLAYLDQIDDAARSSAMDYLQGIAARIAERAPHVRVRAEVAFGKPAGAISTTATETRAALIVMATHGRTGATRAIMGSVAGHVLEHSETPLVLLHPAAVSAPAAARR